MSQRPLNPTRLLSGSPCPAVQPFVLVMAAGLLAIAAGSPAALRAEEPSGLQAAAAIEAALVSAIEQAEPSIVAIARERHHGRDEFGVVEPRPDPFGRMNLSTPVRPGSPEYIPDDYGTGVVVDRNGLILTNYHVLGEDSDLYVTTHERKVYRARIKAADPRSDLAVLSIEAHELTPIKFGDGGNVRKGQIAIALGNPYAIARDGQASASWGIISNIERKSPPTPDERSPTGKTSLHQFGTLLQTDARLNLGTSGGALLNLKGEMIGLTTSLAALSGAEQAAGYALPVDDVFRRVVETLKQGREVEYGFLGVRPENLPPEKILIGRHGVRVHEVVTGTPAYKFDVRPDDIITHIDGKPIHDSDGLVLHVGKLPHDATVRLTLERNGKVVPLNVELTKYGVRGKKIVTNPAPSWRGLRVDYVTAHPDFRDLVNERRVDLLGSVVVTEVERDSPAWQQGLRPDMVISHVGNVRVSSPKEFQAAVAGKNGPVKVRLFTPGEERPVRAIPPTAAAAGDARDG